MVFCDILHELYIKHEVVTAVSLEMTLSWQKTSLKVEKDS